jgi:hypothetical protein
VLVEELDREEPMATWPREKLEEFLETAQPVKERIATAEKLLLGTR